MLTCLWLVINNGKGNIILVKNSAVCRLQSTNLSLSYTVILISLKWPGVNYFPEWYVLWAFLDMCYETRDIPVVNIVLSHDIAQWPQSDVNSAKVCLPCVLTFLIGVLCSRHCLLAGIYTWWHYSWLCCSHKIPFETGQPMHMLVPAMQSSSSLTFYDGSFTLTVDLSL